MQQNAVLNIAVQSLAEYCTAKGDLGGGGAGPSPERMQEGTIAHQRLQKRYAADEVLRYQKEVPLSLEIQREKYVLRLSGRADGIFTGENGAVTLHEIKSTYAAPSFITQPLSDAHVAQMLVYAYLYASQNNLEQIDMRLTYVSLPQQEEVDFLYQKSLAELQALFEEYIADYCLLGDTVMEDRRRLRLTADALAFPYTDFRPNQWEAASQVFTAIKNKNTLFLEAPTGTGKTIATLFPAIKALGQGLGEKIFYLTAKNQTGMVAADVLRLLRERGLHIKCLTLTAKEKTCLQEEMKCDPLLCPYAADFWSKLHDALPHLAHSMDFSTENIREAARQYQLCPHELALSLAELCDCVICDYNYAFDPLVRLKRFFTLGGGFLFLIDEAHNLVDRSREMFSAAFSRETVLTLRGKCKQLPRLYRALTRLNTAMRKLSELQMDTEEPMRFSEPPKEIGQCIQSILSRMDEYAMEGQLLTDGAWEHMKPLLQYQIISDLLKTEFYSIYTEGENRQFTLHLFCMHPSYYLREAMKKGRAAVLFSATLSPYHFYSAMLGGLEEEEKTFACRLPSPFPPENLLVCADFSVRTTFKERSGYHKAIAEKIKDTVDARKGNYLAFFPSFAYLFAVERELALLEPGWEVLVHRPDMTKTDRDAFLEAFQPDRDGALLGLTVLGSHFGEGIDLPGEALSGAIIVGVGLPQVCLERELLREYFEDQFQSGFDFSYVYPGMNKVAQAGGRVIRTAQDRGIILLLDQRFSRAPYRELLPQHWNVTPVTKKQPLQTLLREFWGNE